MCLKILLGTMLLFSFIYFLNQGFSATCYRFEPVCEQYAEIEYNCRSESYSYSCPKNGPHQVWVPKTCTSYSQYKCDSRVVYDTCYDLCDITCYSRYWVVYRRCRYVAAYSFGKPIYRTGRHYKCGVESRTPILSSAYTCGIYQCRPYNCNPRNEPYNCGWRAVSYCSGSNCRASSYDCSGYESRNGPYTGTCHSSRTVCDKTTDYDKCITWGEKEVAYDCSLMKIDAHSLSKNSANLNDEVTAGFYLSDCEGSVNYDLFARNIHLTGLAVCNSNIIEFGPIKTGNQAIILKVRDSYSEISLNMGNLFVTNERGEVDTLNPFNPAIGDAFVNDVESGMFDAKILAGLMDNLSNEEILKNLMMTFGAVGLALTATQAKRIREYIDSLMDKNHLNNQKQQMMGQLEEYEMDYYSKKYLYDSWQMEVQRQLNSKSTYYEIPAPVTLNEINQAKKVYEDYLNSLLNDKGIQQEGEKIIKNNSNKIIFIDKGSPINDFNNHPDAMTQLITSHGIETMTGMVSSAGISLLIASSGACINPAGLVPCSALIANSIITTLENIENKKKYANLMAFLYGCDSKKYNYAKNGQIILNIQIGLNIFSSFIGGYYGNKIYVSNKLNWQNAEYANTHLEKHGHEFKVETINDYNDIGKGSFRTGEMFLYKYKQKFLYKYKQNGMQYGSFDKSSKGFISFNNDFSINSIYYPHKNGLFGWDSLMSNPNIKIISPINFPGIHFYPNNFAFSSMAGNIYLAYEE